jgi:SAM-dependent methyltransferase
MLLKRAARSTKRSFRERLREPSAVLAPSGFLFAKSRARTRLRDYAMQHPATLATRFGFRNLKNFATGQRLRFYEGDLGTVVDHNLGGRWRIYRDRTERLISVLANVRSLDARRARVLCVGPRNEAELLVMAAHGFRLKHITAIDLFSSSPLIVPMDMHRLEFPDTSFDVVYACYVITHSDDPSRACREMLRVTKDGGLIACAFFVQGDPEDPEAKAGWQRVGADAPPQGLQDLQEGRLERFKAYFPEGSIFPVWQEEDPVKERILCSCILRVLPRREWAADTA